MISAVICTYNREKYLNQVLESLVNQTLSKSLFEIIFINNNSPGNTKEVAFEFEAKYPDINFSYFLETNQGLSFARNRGIKESKGKYLTFIDDDAFLESNYLEKIYNYFEENKDVAAIGSKILLHYESVIPDWENKYLNSLLGFFDIGDEEKPFTKKNYPRGSNMSFKTDVFEQVGLFNTDLGRKGSSMAGSEEKDIFQRIYQIPDLKVMYIPDAIVYHCVPIERTTREFIKRQAIGTGTSEKTRVKSEGFFSILNRYFIELIKWGGSIVLFFLFSLKGKVAKGKMIVLFRWWFSLGFIGVKK